MQFKCHQDGTLSGATAPCVPYPVGFRGCVGSYGAHHPGRTVYSKGTTPHRTVPFLIAVRTCTSLRGPFIAAFSGRRCFCALPPPATNHAAPSRVTSQQYLGATTLYRTVHWMALVRRAGSPVGVGQYTGKQGTSAMPPGDEVRKHGHARPRNIHRHRQLLLRE